MRGLLAFLLFMGIAYVVLYLFLWIIYPPCDVVEREKVIGRYESRVNELNMDTLDFSRNLQQYMDASIRVQKELVACHCGPPQSGAEATARMWREQISRFGK